MSATAIQQFWQEPGKERRPISIHRGRGVADITSQEEEEILRLYGRVALPQIAERLGVSKSTLARKLAELEDQGRLERIPGWVYRKQMRSEAPAVAEPETEPEPTHALLSSLRPVPPDAPKCPHYWLSEDARISQVFPRFVEKYGPAPRCEIREVCWRCRMVQKILHYDPITMATLNGPPVVMGILDMQPAQAPPPLPVLVVGSHAQREPEKPQDEPRPAERPEIPEPAETPDAASQERKAVVVEVPFEEHGDPGDEHDGGPSEDDIETLANFLRSRDELVAELNKAQSRERLADATAAAALKESARLREENTALQKKLELVEALVKHMEQTSGERIRDLERRLELATLKLQVYELTEENARLREGRRTETGRPLRTWE